MLLQAARVSGLERALSEGLRPWRARRARHDPGRTVLDLAVAVALGGDCLADVGLLRAQPGLFGAVASDSDCAPADRLACRRRPGRVGGIAHRARPGPGRVWAHRAPVAAHAPLIIDMDATLVEAHSEKEKASATYKRGFGFHPLLAFLDHGEGGTGECLAGLLRPGRATANNAADHRMVLSDALAQLPDRDRARVLVRADSAAGMHDFLEHLHELGLDYSIGIKGSQPIVDALAALPARACAPPSTPPAAPGARGCGRINRLTGPLQHRWPPGMRVLARREHPHPGAQLRITDDGWRITVFATNTRGGGWPTTNAATGYAPAPRTASAAERHRPDQPAATRLRRQPNLAPDHRPGRRPAHLDSAPRAD